MAYSVLFFLSLFCAHCSSYPLAAIRMIESMAGSTLEIHKSNSLSCSSQTLQGIRILKSKILFCDAGELIQFAGKNISFYGVDIQMEVGSKYDFKLSYIQL